jgi:para-nitrobenzyl esterase
MKLMLALIIAMVLAGCQTIPLVSQRDPLVIETKQGLIRGKRVGKADVFLGIPFAEPPVGDLRWRPPVEHAPWDGIRDAIEYALPAPQRIPNPSGMKAASEDCLYPNVFTPVKRTKKSRLPVMVYLHGGSNVQGSSNQWTSGVEDILVSQRNSVVLVTPQFRLGVIGFLAHPALTAESEHKSSGNYGFLDQIAALQWVQDNIEDFGGDPDCVTVFGSSSGSIDTGSLVASPLAAGLFHRAIMQSWPMGAPELSEREKNQGIVFEEEAGCSGAEDVAAALRAVPWEKMIEIQTRLGKEGHRAGRGFYPTVDGWALHDFPLDTIKAGKHNHVPFMIGAQAQDARAWAKNGPKNPEEYRPALEKLAKKLVEEDEVEQHVERLLELYPLDRYENPFWAFVDIMNDKIQTSPNRKIAVAMAENQDEPVYWYVFDHPLAGEYAKYGADHPLICTFFFQQIRAGRLPPWYGGKKPYVPTEADLEMADIILDYWTTFAAEGTLDNVESPPWPDLDPKNPAVQIIRLPVESKKEYKAEQLAYWEELLERQEHRRSQSGSR